jgi:hypothetical protein
MQGYNRSDLVLMAVVMVMTVVMTVVVTVVVVTVFVRMRTGRAVRRFTSSSCRWSFGWRVGWTAALRLAVVDTLKEATIPLVWIGCAIEVKSSSVGIVSVLRIEAKLGLYGSTVDAETVEALASTTSQLHVLLTAVGVNGERNLEVHASDEFGVWKLPYVDMVASDDTGKSLNVLSNLRDANMLGSSLQKNARSTSSKRNTCLENNGGDKQGDSRVSVDLARPVGKPDDKSSDHDTNVTKHISNDVQNHGVHTHVSVVVTVAILLLGVLGESVVMTLVNTRVSSRSSGMWVRMGVRSVLAVTERWAILGDTLEKRWLLIRLILFHNQGVLSVSFALAGGLVGLASGSFDDALSETCGVDAQVVETSETRMSTPTGSMIVAASGMSVCLVRFTVGLSGCVCALHDSLGQNLSGATAFVSERAVIAGVALLGIVGVVVRMSVIMIVVVVVFARAMGVTMASKNKETDKVG